MPQLQRKRNKDAGIHPFTDGTTRIETIFFSVKMLANGMTMTDEDRNSTRSLINQRCVDDYAVRPKNKRGSVSSIPLSIDLMLEEDSGGEDMDASSGEKEEQTENSQSDRSKDQGERKSRRRISQVSLDSGLERDSHSYGDIYGEQESPDFYL